MPSSLVTDDNSRVKRLSQVLCRRSLLTNHHAERITH